ncbi:uncharacterized protein LOC124306447 isoform X1 [Neodiprion virginianus]|uniref:uncharacterized protein LOC124306447 isoform X1 n=2 Tax=Neodiprion virginianus TaxID=2961670 RepID=UPI001EE6C218|nr:uncharacterized protein LOC124306447 isoform X1 [Neodiprion virginianus]
MVSSRYSPAGPWSTAFYGSGSSSKGFYTASYGPTGVTLVPRPVQTSKPIRRHRLSSILPMLPKQDSEYQATLVPWWQRVWSSYYPPPHQPPVFSAGFISWILSMIAAIGVLGFVTSPQTMQNIFSELLLAARDLPFIVRHGFTWSTNRVREAMSCDRGTAVEDSEISSVCDDCRSDLSADVTRGASSRRDVRPVSYGTNWTPRPTYSGHKESQRKYQEKTIRTSAVTVAGGTIRHDDEKLSPRQLRHRRGCHTVVPSNSSDKSSGC